MSSSARMSRILVLAWCSVKPAKKSIADRPIRHPRDQRSVGIVSLLPALHHRPTRALEHAGALPEVDSTALALCPSRVGRAGCAPVHLSAGADRVRHRLLVEPIAS